MESDFSTRLLSVVAFSGMNQGSFAKMIDVSPGFLSDVLRGLKKPGTDFFIKLKNNIDVSLDWLISGQGVMTGHKAIDHRLMSAIELQVAVVKAAIIDNNNEAKDLLSSLRRDNFQTSDLEGNYDALLNALVPSNSDLQLFVDLYNRNILLNDSKTQKQNTLSAALIHYEASKPNSKLSKLSGEINSPTKNINTSMQINKGKSKRIDATQNNYFGNKD